MRIQFFKNGKALIHGDDPKRIISDIEGTLKIGTVEIKIAPGIESVLPSLFNGYTGYYDASFTSVIGNVYEIEKVAIKGGRIVPPSQTTIELVELRCRADALEAECEKMKQTILELSNIFDTNSLNFLIK
jgi:hypothetical protein